MDVNALLYQQDLLVEEIKKLLINFKKDGPTRRTPDLIKRRLETLESRWKEFKGNHEKLTQYLTSDDDYFVSDCYKQAKQVYVEVKQYIEKESFSVTPKPSPAAQHPSKTQEIRSFDAEKSTTSRNIQPLQPPTNEEEETPVTHLQAFDWNEECKTNTGCNSKLDEMLKRQGSNFKAFARTVSNIKIETIQEKWEFEDTLKILQARWKAIDLLHWEIDSELDGSNLQYEASFTENEQKYYEIKKIINTKLWSVSHREKSTPQLDIPIFNGQYQQWVSFKDLFTEAIHSNHSLSNAQKMQFLKSKIKGEAERLIQHLQISSENYITSWEILNHRYNNKKLIFTTHMNTMMNIPVTQQSNANHIKRLHDVTTECLNAIKNLGIDINTWDPILVYILSQKLDAETHNDYLESLKEPREIPSLKDFMTFLENKFTTMESARRKQENYQQRPSVSNRLEKSYNIKHFSSNKAITQSNTGSRVKCPMCSSTEHGIYFCKNFLEMSPTQKRQTISRLNLCINCLYEHRGKSCTSSKRCRECNGSHNTILHSAYAKNNMTPTDGTTKFTTYVTQQCDIPEIMLPTALVKIQRFDGEYETMRALIDQGSQVSIITTNAAKKLGLRRRKCNGVVTGVGIKDNACTGMTSVKCSSISENYTFKADVYIMKSLTRNLPNNSFQKPSWEFMQKIRLADPDFNVSKPIDILLGVDIYTNIIMEGIYRANNLVAQQTQLGWILCGKIQTLQCNVTINNLQEMQRFWEIEDLCENKPYSSEESKCIEFYKLTTTRSADGSYTVRLPLKSNIDQLGQSKYKAVAQFQQLERKFNKNEEIKIAYESFMHEYQQLHHMQLVNSSYENVTQSCYLPHHCVLRADSSTTTHRVVFNASETTSSGLSLNDCMCKGPNLQKDILNLIVGWRQFQVAFIADIEKMFRQIWLHEDDQALQKIIWRDSPNELMREYQLATVTYGTKAAPFLAMMTLRQLASDERKKYPEAAQVLENNFYMDDLVYCTDSVGGAIKLKQDLIDLLKSGGFNLRKWISNYQDLVDKTSNQEQDNYNFKTIESTKTLGLTWIPDRDVFTFQCKIDVQKINNTKRSLLSAISQLYDPLGWLTPLSTKLKLLFQKVWKTNMTWDEKLPEEIYHEWESIKSDITQINTIEIPRWLGSCVTDLIELHGFSDASQKAYACVVYCKVIKSGQADIKLLVGKSRLVPCNKEISLPRLELSGSLLLAKLMEKIKQSLSSKLNIKVYGWTDSMAVLGWLQGNPDRWKPFVANRVSKITDIMPPECWNYIKSSENPADCASRGLTTSQLIQHPLWWQGPAWLPTYLHTEREQEHLMYTTREKAKVQKQVNAVIQNSDSNLIKKMLLEYSSFQKVVRVVAWIRRFGTKKELRVNTPYLTIPEIRAATKNIVKQVQREVFEEEICSLKEKKQVATRSKILNLNPFLDMDGVLRVGGRLQFANISSEMKNPVILPQSHRLTDLIIKKSHELTLHGGARVTLAFTRQKYWILKGYTTIKKYVHKCVICRKQKPTLMKQIMGDLPEARVNPSRPFQNTGVDFTGHVLLKANKGRGITTTKGYVSVFVCMATKAIHLELVSDLSTSAFIAALRRMAARRGTPSNIYCDNGRNFVGANRIIQQEYQEIIQIFKDKELQQELVDMEISFHFNAPAWPSAGGLWEAAVKSFKFHLKRVIGEQKLTYEEYSTLLTQIEACLNSRPLCPLTDDPDDLNYITPSHFLSSGPVLTLVETERDLRTRWNLTQQILQDIWKRWAAEYLTQLTSRSKWKQTKENIKINDVALVHEENLPPGKWIMGRVVELHPGQDGFVRVVTLKTKSGYIKRPVIKLSKLINHEDDSETRGYKNTIVNNTNSENKSQRQETRRITRNSKRNIFTSMIMTFLFFLTYLSSSTANVNITQFRANQSLYFDKVANMLLIKDEWKLLIYYEMKPYWDGKRALETYIKTLDRTCNTIRQQTHCDALLIQLHHGIKELEYYDQLLQSQQLSEQTSRRRVRRGLINGVGYLANSLFGVLDERFADQYKQDIRLLQENQKHIVNLWKNQTSIAESQNNLLKRTESAMNQQYKIVNQHMITLDKATETLKNNVQVNNIVNDFTIGSIMTNNLLGNLKNLQNTLLDTITDIHQGRFNVHLLTPDQLIEELSTISSTLPKDVLLPIDNIHSDLSKLYNLIKIKTRMLQEYLLFEIKIPLITRETYEILRIVPVPQYYENKIITLSPVSDYVAVNIKKDIFIPMSEMDVKACYIQSETYYCHNQKPEYRMKSDSSLCEKEDKECKGSASLCKEKWQESFIINSYIYICCAHCQVRVMCEDQITAHQLTGAGLLSVNHGCIIKTEEFTIYPHKPHTSEVRVSPDLYTPTIAPINHIINISIPSYKLSNKSHEEFKEALSAIERKIQETKDNEILPDTVSFHDIHHYVMIYVILGIMVVIGMAVLLRRISYRWCCTMREQKSNTEQGEDQVAPAQVTATAVLAAEGTRHERRTSDRDTRAPTVHTSRFKNISTSPVLRKYHDMFNSELA